MNKPRLWASTIGAVLLATGAMAQTVGACEGSAASLILPELSDDAYVSFANGAIRLADIYVDANLVSSVAVVVFHPRQSDLAGGGTFTACSIVYSTRTRSPYFGQVFLREANAAYDAARGLTVTIPVRYDYHDQASVTGALEITVNQKQGYVDAVER